jgi:aspartyl-tRNA(Asn)/glutamyl-tRNA(Gln) amidotransferase subunit A
MMMLIFSRAFESYFIQAQRVRRLIQQSFDKIFTTPNILHTNSPPHTPNPPKHTPTLPTAAGGYKCDVILCPTTVGPAPALETISQMTSSVEMYVNDVFTVPGSLAGLPAVSIPVRVGGDVVGLQVVGQVGMDLEVLQAARYLERLLNTI